MLALLFCIALAADDPQANRVDIAARLVADGFFDRAAIVLAEIEEPRKADRGRYHTLRGLVALETGDPQGAVDALSTAIDIDPEAVETATWVYLGAAYEQLERPADALDTLTRGEPDVLGLAAAWHLKARVLADLERPDDAYATAMAGSERFPSHRGLVEERFTQLTELGLTHEVALEAPDALWEAGADETTWLTLTRGLLDAGAPYDAQILGEAARLTFLDSPRPRVALATACMATESWRCAGTMLDEAAAFDAQYAVQAAESFRRAGDLARALYLNGRVTDPKEKARQRLGLLLELRAFAEASALDARLTRLGLVEEDQVAYALAYAHATVGNRDRAAALLTRLTDPSLVRLGTTLLESLTEGRAP
jgi:tetratricopeptide (TPR) repeat protein